MGGEVEDVVELGTGAFFFSLNETKNKYFKSSKNF